MTKIGPFVNDTLANPREASAYLITAMEDGDKDVIKMALMNIAHAHGIDIGPAQYVCDFGSLGAMHFDCIQESTGDCAHANHAGFTTKENCVHWVRMAESK